MHQEPAIPYGVPPRSAAARLLGPALIAAAFALPAVAPSFTAPAGACGTAASCATWVAPGAVTCTVLAEPRDAASGLPTGKRGHNPLL